MRFASVPLPQPSEPRSPAAEFVRKLIGAKPEAPVLPPQAPPELPVDLDQRVRLIGEW